MRVALAIIAAVSAVAAVIFAIVDSKEEAKDENEEKSNEDEGKSKRKIKKIFKLIKRYGKSIALAIIAIVCVAIVYSSFEEEVTAVTTMYDISKEAYDRYMAKNESLSGTNYHEKVMRKATQSAASKEEYLANGYSDTGYGDTLFYDPITHEYFLSSFPKIRSIEKHINELTKTHAFTSLNEFYKPGNIKPGDSIKWLGKSLGWSKGETVKFLYYPTILDDDVRAVVISFTINPHYRKEV